MELIKIQASAVEKIRALWTEFSKPEGTMVRVGIKGGGCSGFSYTFSFEQNPPTKFDHVIESDGVKLIIDKKSAIYMAGTELEYENTLMKSGFVFKNPRAKTTCGCGSSFAA
jgi:iron-sulfur cluster assembly protein